MQQEDNEEYNNFLDRKIRRDLLRLAKHGEQSRARRAMSQTRRTGLT
ncbi:MAG: hypothetical protein JXD22_16980 [Sedimentisphaerales bacterium]|nr:hypothetical protein [Sedimentisphaerales bacterium]